MIVLTSGIAQEAMTEVYSLNYAGIYAKRRPKVLYEKLIHMVWRHARDSCPSATEITISNDEMIGPDQRYSTRV